MAFGDNFVQMSYNQPQYGGQSLSFANPNYGQQGGGNWGQAAGGPAYQQMMSYMPQVQQANQAYQINMQDPYQQQQYGGNQYAQWGQQNNVYDNNRQDEDRRFRMNGGTEGLYNGRYRDANLMDTLAIEAGRAGEWWMNLPGQIAGAVGGEQAKQDWTFDANKFDITQGFSDENLKQLRNFAVSLPGMIPGGLFEGAERGYEAATGAPVREYREKQGGGYEVADYQLDASQRAAAAIDSAIDIGGTFLGASGKVVSTVGKGIGRNAEKSAVKAAAAFEAGDKTKFIKNAEDAARYKQRADRLKEFNDNLGRGVFDRAGMGKGAQFAWNVGEEAGEEFVQSYADDIRMKNLDEGSFDRALTGAAWGALGGGMMHGTMALADKAFGSGGNAVSDPSVSADPVQDSEFEMYKKRNDIGYRDEYRATNAALTRAAERQREPHDIPASTSQFGTIFDQNLGLNQARFTEGGLHAMLQADDYGESLKHLAQRFHTTEDQIVKIDRLEDENERVAEWNKLIQDANSRDEKVQFVAGRNPDTNKIGVADVDILEIKSGQGVEMHPWLYKALGGDIDGDKYQSYFGIEPGQFGYYTRRLIDWVTGEANIDKDYVSFLNMPELTPYFSKTLNSYLANLDRPLSNKTKRYYVDKFREATSNEDSKEGVNLLAQLLDQLRHDLAKHTDGDGAYDFADSVISNLVADLDFRATRTANVFDRVVKHLSDEEKSIVDQFSELVPETELYLRSGDNQGQTHYADFIGWFGGKIGINIGFASGNPIMRQSGAYRYESKKDETVFFGDVDMAEKPLVEDRFANLIAFSFMLERVGADVENSIEGVWRASVQEVALSKFHAKYPKIDINGNFDEFMDILVEARNQMVKPFNNALDRQSTDYGRAISVGAKKTDVDASSVAAKAKMFNEIFGDYRVEEILDLAETDPNYGKTFNQVIEEYATAPGRDFGPFSQFEGFGEFFQHMCNAYGINQRNVGSKIDESIKSLASNIRQLGLVDASKLIEIITDEDGGQRIVLTTDDEESVFYIVDATNFLFGEDESLALQLGTLQQFLASEYGREWMTGDESRMHNALLSARLSYRYRNAIDLQEEASGDWRADVEKELYRIAQDGGTLDVVVYEAFKKTHDLSWLQWLTSLDNSWEDKVKFWDSIQLNNPGAGSLTSELFVTSNTKLGTSALTQRIQKANRSMTQAVRRNNKLVRDSLERLEEKNFDDKQKIDAIKHFARTGYTKMSMNAVAAFVHSQRDIVKGMVDKGVAPETSDIIYQMLEHQKNGDVFSYLEGLNYELGTMEIGKLQINRVQLCNILFDPELEIRVYDPDTDGYLRVSQKTIFDEILGENSDRNPDTDWGCWLELMNACPAIATILAPTNVVVTTENGKQSVTEGMSSQLGDAVIDYCNGQLKDTTGPVAEEELRNEVTQYMFSDPNWWGCFLASIEDIDKSASLAATRNLIDNALKDHVDWVLRYASLPPNGDGYAQKCLLWDQSGIDAAIQTIENLFDDSVILDELKRVVRSSYESITDSVAHDSMEILLTEYINSELRAAKLPELGKESIEENSLQNVDIRESTENLPTDVKRALAAVLNMIDLSSTRIGTYLSSLEFNTRLHEHFDSLLAENTYNNEDLEKIRDKVSAIRKGDLKSFLDFLGYSNITDLQNEFPEIIPNEAVDTWSADKFCDAIDVIAAKYNINDDMEKAKKQARDAWEDNDHAAKVDLKNYFNQAVLTYSTNNIVAHGEVYNSLAAKQTLEAYRTMSRLGDKVRDKMKDRLEFSDHALPQLHFNYSSPVTSYMSASVAMNAASGSITSGISMDGSMMKLVAGFGLLNDYECDATGTEVNVGQFDIGKHEGLTVVLSQPRLDRNKKPVLDNSGNPVYEDTPRRLNARLIDEINAGKYGSGPFVVYSTSDCLCGACKRHMPMPKSRNYSRGNYLAHSISLLANWMQEAKHLKAKKALGVFKAFSDPMSVDRSLSSGYSIQEIESLAKGNDDALPQSSREFILGALKAKRGDVAQFWKQTLDAADGLKLPDDVPIAFANATTPLIEVVVRNDDGVEVTEYVSAAFLANDELFAAHYASGETPLLLNDPSRIVTIRPVVMGLQEVAGRIVRHVCNQYYQNDPDNAGKVTISDIHSWASDAMKDWDSYNARPLSMKRFLNGIASQGMAFDGPVMGDANPSSKMLLNDEFIASLRHTFTPRRKHNTTQMSDDVWGEVVRLNNAARKAVSKDDQRFFDHYRITYITGSREFDSTEDHLAETLRNHDRKDFGDYEMKYQASDSKTYNLVEMYIGKSAKEADAAYRAAQSTGRSCLVPVDLVEKMPSVDELSVMLADELDAININGRHYVRLDPSRSNYIKSWKKGHMQIPIIAMDPDEIQCAVGLSRFNFTDAAHLTRKGYKAGRAFRGRTNIHVDDLLPGTNPVLLVTDADELARINPDDINYDYYRNNIRGKSVDDSDNATYKRNALAYIDKMAADGASATKLRNVHQDECVGFVKQLLPNGKVEYAPLFYEGSVAHMADVVTVSAGTRGTIEINYAASNVSYSHNESMKLDLYGVAYKSVGYEATDEQMKKWAALDDSGFDIMLMPDHCFDVKSLASRVFELGDTILHRNLYFFTRKAGVNLFYTRNGKQWELREDLSKQIKDNPSILVDLTSGSLAQWEKVASGEISIFQDDKMNKLVARLTDELLLAGGYPHLFFNSARIDVDPASNVGTFVGLERRFMDPRVIMKYMNTDDTLYFYNKLDSRLCPATLDADPNTDGDIKVFDKRGQMLDRNTVSGNPERVATILGPHYYTGEGTAIGDYSRNASWSHQHTLKRLLDMGVYSRNVADMVASLGIAVDNINDTFDRGTRRKRVEDWRKKNANIKMDTDPKFLQRVQLSMDDPIFLSSIAQYRRSLIDLGKEFSDPLTIVKDLKSKESAFNDATMKRDMEAAVQKINYALGASGSTALNLSDVVTLVRFMLGYSNNNGLGIQSITFRQFQNATDQMLENLDKGVHIITGGKFTRVLKEYRVSIPMLPKGLNSRLMATSKYQKEYHGDINKLINDQYEMLRKDTMDAIKHEEDPGKRNALFKICDAVCYMNGKDTISGHIGDNVYMYDLVQAVKQFGFMIDGWDPELLALYDENTQLSEEYIEKLVKSAESRRQSRVDLDGNGEYKIVFHDDDRTIVTYILRSLEAARRSMGLSYTMMLPANLLERGVNQAELSMAMRLGQSGIGPYKAPPINRDVRNQAVKAGDFKKLWSALREAELLGLDRSFIFELRNTKDIDQAIANTFKTQGAMERFNQRFMNVMSGKDAMIEGQMKNFIDRFWQRSTEEAPWWHQVLPGQNMTLFEQRLLNDPAGLIVDIFNGNSAGKSADVLLARQCMNWAKRGDMAQRNLVSAIYSEIASRSPGVSFAMTTLVTPYFQYATNRMGRILQWVAPISSLHYLATKFFSTGPGSTLQFMGVNFGDMALEDVNLHASLKEAMWCDVCHLGVGMTAMILVGLASMASGVLEPPEDDDKKGNFKEWTIFGLRVDENWWIEDVLGLALPLATFYASCSNGEPRLDLITNGLAYYLSNNPAVKVADAVSILFDPMAELYREYDKDLEGYAKAMGGPPDVWSIASGKTTSFGLSYIAQFFTPGILKEIYNHSQQWEKSYKRIYDIDETGRMTEEGRDENKTQYTTYEDAVIRKFTKGNPVMGFLADMVLHPETGYMYHEMPNLVIYDPAQMNSIEVFSIYEDPYTKQVEKPYEQQLAIGYQLISTLQGNSVEYLKSQGFMIDYDTKKMVSQLIWDMIADENTQWAELEQNGSLNYYTAGEGDFNEGQRIVSEMKQAHYNYVNNLKSLYYDKLWSDELKYTAQYNQRRTSYAQDVNGEWYATGDYPGVWEPIMIAPGETQGDYQYVMSRENDWQTESVVTGAPTGIRALVPVDAGNVETPNINSWSTDGSDTGHSDLYNKIANNTDNQSTASNKTTSGYPKSSGGSGYRRSYGGGGGGYYRRPGGGGGRGYSRGGSGYSPNIYAPSVDINNPRASRIMNTDRIQKADLSYLRPDFETKGSREAYKRSDI